MTGEDKILHGQIVPAEARGVRMPSGTPLGLGILGAMKFAAISRVIDQYERALRSKDAAIAAEEAVARSIVRREDAIGQLHRLDTIREEASDRIVELAATAKLRRRLERLQLETQVAEEEARLNRVKGASNDGDQKTAATDEFSAFVNDLKKMPDIVKAVAAAKEQIIKDAGGTDKLTEAQTQACELFDAMLQSFISKKAGDAAL